MSVQIPSAKAGGPSLEVSEDVFARDFNESLVHQLVVAYFAAGRAGTKKQKTRSEVSGGGAKPWKQKGSGRARAGTTRSPIWRTGGVTFAARPRSYEQKLNKKMYRAAMRSILSELLRQGRIAVIDNPSPAEAKTRALIGKLNEFGFDKGLIIVDEADKNLILAARNIPHIEVCEANKLSPVALVGSEKVMITVEAAKRIEDALS